MLEQLADYDDELMEQLLSDVQPPRDKVFADLVKEMQDGLIVPVLLGSAENGNGILRLLKALRHEAPFVDRTAKRLKLENAKSAAHVLKTIYTPHGGKLSIVRVLAGEFGEGTVVQGARSEERAAAAFSMLGQDAKKRAPAKAGETVALGRLEKILLRRDAVGGEGRQHADQGARAAAAGLRRRHRRQGPQGRGEAHRRAGQADGGGPLAAACEHAKDTHQMVLWGQGEMHLRVALERLKRKYGVEAESQAAPGALQGDHHARASRSAAGTRSSRAATASSATWCSTSSRCRAASGFQFDEKITGGVVPRQFIPSVEIGVSDYPAARAARRLPGGRRVGDADRRLLPLGRLLRHGLPPGRPHRHGRGHAQVQSGPARADHGGGDRHPHRCHRARQRHDPAAARPDPGLRRARGLARLGCGAGAACRSRRWPT